ncbi:hypothetical protein CGMCC3_g11021 [Colletotrichum fructicola]|nr:uncharacterized protein CGMCC3_g11021 [Colletotrichum fructicola]KAE9572951.1 hypothetical protein CGMCC3_g11021 [Colletotrichum fructicola]
MLLLPMSYKSSRMLLVLLLFSRHPDVGPLYP